MNTTLELLDELMRAVKIRAAERNMKLEEVVADALRAALTGLDGALAGSVDPVQALARRLVLLPDGKVNNPCGLADSIYFDVLETVRADSRLQPWRNPFESA